MTSHPEPQHQRSTWKDTCVAYTWGSAPAERQQPFPCDPYLVNYDDIYFRAITIAAPASIVFRWLCQLRAAPYSYDWLDNFGRRSPPELIAGLDQLAVGQRVMTIFRLVAFEKPKHLTLVLASPAAQRLFGQIALSYLVVPCTSDTSRLVVKFLIRYPRNIAEFPMRWLLPWGDVFMMRKQFLTFKHLAEAHAARLPNPAASDT